MSFSGDLEHIPIVDVIQLLHSTRKTGTLCVRGRKGECQLVFKDGYIVSANHFNTSVRIGKILVEMKAISQQSLDEALLLQKMAIGGSKPLIATLLEQEKIAKKTAYKGLETLIEMTVVEMLTWSSGQFALNVDSAAVSDEYRYFPEKLHEAITLDTQMVLMDALRIFDEKIRDGEIEVEPKEEAFLLEEIIEEGANGEKAGSSDLLSADLLGLDDLDGLERTVPQVFKSLGSFDPSEIHSQVIRESLPGLPPAEADDLLNFLMIFTSSSSMEEAPEHPTHQERTLVFFSPDAFMRHAVMTLCKHDGILVYAGETEEELVLTLDTVMSRGADPLLVFDSPRATAPKLTKENLAGLRQRLRARFPLLHSLQFATPEETSLTLDAYSQGSRAVLPRPSRNGGKSDFTQDITLFLETFLAYIHRFFQEQEHQIFSKLTECTTVMQELKEASDVSLCLLSFVTDFFERSLTFVVRSSELVAEQGIGILSDKSAGPSAKLKFAVPLEPNSLLHRVVGEGRLFFQNCDDPQVEKHLFSAIAPPTHTKILLLPIKTRSRTIALIYADFGALKPTPVPTEILEILAIQAGLSLENALCRKQLEKLSSKK